MAGTVEHRHGAGRRSGALERFHQPQMGKGHSTPLIIGNRVFLTTAVPTGRRSDVGPNRSRAGGGVDAGLEHRFEVVALDRDTGKVVWQRTALVATPHEGYHRTYGSFAS